MGAMATQMLKAKAATGPAGQNHERVIKGAPGGRAGNRTGMQASSKRKGHDETERDEKAPQCTYPIRLPGPAATGPNPQRQDFKKFSVIP
jgi:hypothetical protein